MKRKTAREILAESFRELAGSRPVDKITVTNIIENCGYSKSTFYRLFKDKYDLMAWDYAQRLQAIISQTQKADYEWKQILWDVARLIRKNKARFKAAALYPAQAQEKKAASLRWVFIRQFRTKTDLGIWLAGLDTKRKIIRIFMCRSSSYFSWWYCNC